MSLRLIPVLPLLSVDVPRTHQVVVSLREAQPGQRTRLARCFFGRCRVRLAAPFVLIQHFWRRSRPPRLECSHVQSVYRPVKLCHDSRTPDHPCSRPVCLSYSSQWPWSPLSWPTSRWLADGPSACPFRGPPSCPRFGSASPSPSASGLLTRAAATTHTRSSPPISSSSR